MDDDLLLIMGDNIGYFGPFEHLWRGLGDERIHWSGCKAGQTVLALEADGTVKGCPSLPTSDYAGGNVRDLSLEQTGEAAGWSASAGIRPPEGLWGFCHSCYYAEVCGGGCTWMSHSLLGRPGNNPYCHHRAAELQKRGLRERVVKLADARAVAFCHRLVRRPRRGRRQRCCATTYLPSAGLVDLPRQSAPEPVAEATLPPRLELCRACNCCVWPNESSALNCGMR